MKHFIKVADYKWAPGSTKKMMYKDDNGEWFVGLPHNVTIGKIVVVEISEGLEKDGYRHIIKFV